MTLPEEVSVVLRRQIPIRHGEPPRSWIGGLPQMPVEVPWPKGTSWDPEAKGRSSQHPTADVYLHFVAQIACADLPAKLWGGLGPREGWLLLFLDAQDPAIEENGSTLQVIYIDRLGPERLPPQGILSVRNEVYTGYDYNFIANPDEIPCQWRRWPVDLVEFPNDNRKITSADLYGDLVKIDNTSSASKQIDCLSEFAFDWPHTWRGALYVVDSIIRAIRNQRAPSQAQIKKERTNFSNPDWLEKRIAGLRKKLAEQRQSIDKFEAAAKAAREQRPTDSATSGAKRWELLPALSRLILAIFTANQTKLAERGVARPEMLARVALSKSRADKIESAIDLFEAHARAGTAVEIYDLHAKNLQALYDWHQARLPDLAALREKIGANDLDASMSVAMFRPIFDHLANTRMTYLYLDQDSIFREGTSILLSMARSGLLAAKWEVTTDQYTGSGIGAARIPKHLLEAYEPKWRYVDRVHRMGGIHDGVQSDAGPSGKLLLFQIAHDRAMQWAWGDGGAYYVFITPHALEARNFSNVEWRFENH